MQRPPVPPFTRETALAKVQAAEDAWNSRDPEKVAQAYTPESEWRNRGEFFVGRDAIVEFLTRKWQTELHYRLMKELWAFTDDRISVRFEYEWQHAATGQWHRTHGNEHWEFDDDGYMRRRDMSANDVPITADERRIGTGQQRSGTDGKSIGESIMNTISTMRAMNFRKLVPLLLITIFSIAFVDITVRAEYIAGVEYEASAHD